MNHESSEDFTETRLSPLTPTLFTSVLSAGDIMTFNRVLTFSALAGLVLATIGEEYRPACEAVEAAILNASRVYYPGEYGRL